MTFLERLQAGLRGCGIAGTRVLVAVSGGADSVALLRGTAALREDMELSLAAGHLNHRLRGEESAADARWVAELCAGLGISLACEVRDVAGIAAAEGAGIEETARRVRYAFLEEAAVRLQCDAVAVAHTADDQAETILHHVLRGTGLDGLAGMRPARRMAGGVRLVRPMLEIERNEVAGYLAELRQEVRSDPTNLDQGLTRNRIRHALLPLLRQEYNPQVAEALRRLGRQAAEASEALESLARSLLDQASLERGGDAECRIDCAAFAGQPRHLVRTCFTLLWRELGWPRQRMGFAEWERLAELTAREGAASLPHGVNARQRAGRLVLRRK